MNVSIELNQDKSERVNYNDKGFPAYGRKALLSYYPNYAAVSHWHDDLEFIVVLSGHMNYRVNDEVVDIQQGEGIFVNSRQMHYGFSEDFMECEFICILLNPVLFCTLPVLEEQYIRPLLQNEAFPFCILNQQVEWQKNIIEELKRLYDALRTRSLLQVQTGGFVIINQLYGRMKRGMEVPVHRKHQLTTMKEMMGYIQKHYKEKIALADIAQAGEVCKSSCSTIFQTYLNRSPMLYLMEYRLQKSMELMNETDLSVTEISLEVGFSGVSYYIESFRKYYDVTPKVYRKTHRPRVEIS